MTYILEKATKTLIPAEIVPMQAVKPPLKKDGWQFHWRQLYRSGEGRAFILRTLNSPTQIEGALLLKAASGMCIMDVLELAPHNIGRQHKRYDDVAGCLIAFACRESFKIEGDYKGFLTFTSKTSLIGWYMEKYGAQRANGWRMFFDPETGHQLIKKYLERLI